MRILPCRDGLPLWLGRTTTLSPHSPSDPSAKTMSRSEKAPTTTVAQSSSTSRGVSSSVTVKISLKLQASVGLARRTPPLNGRSVKDNGLHDDLSSGLPSRVFAQTTIVVCWSTCYVPASFEAPIPPCHVVHRCFRTYLQSVCGQ